MSVKGIHWAQDIHGVGPYKKCLLLNLGEAHNIHTGLCIIDQVMLARDSDMTDRTARKYLKELADDDKLISRNVVRTGSGWQTHYVLHFDRSEPQRVVGSRKDVPAQKRELSRKLHSGSNQVSAGTQVPDPSGTQVPDPSGTCVPAHKEHEGYTKDSRSSSGKKPDKPDAPSTKKPKGEDDTEILESFDRLWSLWPALGKERSASKSDCLDQLRRSAKTGSAPAIVEAARRFVAKTADQYVPGLHRWLKQRRFEHFLPPDLVDMAQTEHRAGQPTAAPQAKPSDDPMDWATAVKRYALDGVWSQKRLGARPDEFGYRGPLAPVEVLLATGNFGFADPRGLKDTIDRLRAAQHP